MVQFSLIVFQWLNLVTRRQDKTRIRFLVLTSVYLIFNLTWVSLLETLSFSTWSEIPTIGFLGIGMIGYTCYYLLRETSVITPIGKSFKLIIILSGTYCAFEVVQMFSPQWVITYISYFLLGLIQLFAILGIARFVKPIVRSKIRNGSLSPIYSASLVVACIYGFAPFLFGLVNEQSTEFILINVPYLILSLAYIGHYLNQSKSEFKLLQQENSSDTLHGRFVRTKRFIDEVELTDRQKEIAQLVLLGYSYKSISDKLFLAEASVRKHASNIFKKSGVSNLLEFKQNFKSRPATDDDVNN
jgi:DNA-binding CsgD family transcriptional regulator